MNAGSQIVTLVEIDIPFCVLTYGQTPCQAQLGVTGADRCHNTCFTCQDLPAYSPSPLTLRFARPQEDLLQYGPLIPLLESVATTPSSVNLASMEKNSSGFGQRESVTLTMNDVTHSDLLVDKYRLQRSYDPSKQGTFWGKFIARNPYHAGYEVRIYEGEIGDALGDMRVRHYIVDHIDGPKDGQVRVTCKDLFSKVEARKAVAPLQSRGELKFDITAAAGSATLNPAGIGNLEYPASGFIAIGDECIAFTRAADALTLTTRGALNTVAADHKVEDLVQLVVNFVALSPPEIAKELLVTYAGMVDGVDFTFSDWTAKATEIIDLYTARITKPTPVADLIGELQQQAGFTLWPDVRDGMIKFSALRASAATVTVTDNEWIKDGSLAISRQTQNRISQVWLHYGQIKPNGDLSDRTNYYSTLIEDDPLAEGATQYGEIIVREVFSRWIPQFGRTPAQRTGQRLLAMYRDAPLEAEFTLYASRAGQIAFDRYFNLQIQEVQDEFGAATSSVMAPTMIENGEDYVNIRCQEVKFPSSPPPGGSEIVIYIENDALDLNLRTIFDSIFATFTAPIRFIVEPGVIVGSTSTGSPAITTGSWPSGTNLTLENKGRIQGRGGIGGVAGYQVQNGAIAPTPSTPGTNGGPALQVTVPLSVVNAAGEIWSGGGGGGGAGGMTMYMEFMIKAPNGGGGAGTIAGSGVADNFTLTEGGTTSQNGSSTAGGTAGVKGAAISIHGVSQAFLDYYFNPRNLVGAGGNGGGPGLDGTAGTNAGTDAAELDAIFFAPGADPFYVLGFAGTGAAGGIKGAYIVGNANVTWVSNGDRRGSVS